MNRDQAPAVCQLCGEPMPDGEEMFYYHGYSGPCPGPPLPPEPKPPTAEEQTAKLVAAHRAVCTPENCVLDGAVEHEKAFGRDR